MELISYLLRHIKLNNAECEAIDEAFNKQTFAKGTILAHPDNHHQNVYFIEKGLLRAFYNLDGKDITHYFFDENNFLVSFLYKLTIIQSPCALGFAIFLFEFGQP